jgi:hypothetical protein
MVVSEELAALKEGSDGNGTVDFGRKFVNETALLDRLSSQSEP